MTQQLKGIIYWAEDDFKYKGLLNRKIDHIVEPISNVVIDEHMIKFYIPLYEIGGITWCYNVNLTIDLFGNKYNGTFTEATDGEWTGEVSCELFSNEKKYMLYGNWIEDETTHTFWAIVDK